MSSDGCGSDHGTASIPYDAPSPSPSPPRLVQLRSRIIIHTDTNNPNPYQPTPSSFLDDLTDPFNPINPFPPAGINPNRPSNPYLNPIDPPSLPDDDSADTYSPTSSLVTASSSPNTSETLNAIELYFLGLHAAREALLIYQNRQPPLTDDDDLPEEAFMLSESELYGLDREIYGHLSPEEHGLTFSRRELRQLFDKADARWRTRTPSPVGPSPAASSTFSWEGTHRREERQRIFDAWEEFRNRILPSPGMLQGFLNRVAREDSAREDVEEPVEEARRVEAPRTSRRRNFDEVDPDSEDEAEARGRSRRRIDFEGEGEPRYRGRRRSREGV
jgi:hypothetical protein